MAACVNCFDNCNNGITLDTCVRYTGEGDEDFNISSGDSLYSVLNEIITALANGADPSVTLLSSIGTSCSFFNNILAGQSLTIQNVITALVSSVCTLNTNVTAITPSVTSFNTGCLTLSASPTRDQILQATVTLLCTLNTSVTGILADYVKASQLCTLVNQCIAANVSTQEYIKMSKYIAYPYHGPTSVFDSNGKGISASGYDKVYMCLGQTVNGFTLPDYRGRSPIGANVNIPLSGMDSTVNPALPANAAYAIANKQKKGTYTDALTLAQSPAHTHSITDPGHTHPMNASTQSIGDDNNSTLLRSGGSLATLSSTTGITINSTGGGQAHNSTHPVIGGIFIMYVV